MGWEGAVSGDNSDWLLMSSRDARMTPVRKLSMSVAALASCGVGTILMAATDGVETHDGGPRESEYPGMTLDSMFSPIL